MLRDQHVKDAITLTAAGASDPADCRHAIASRRGWSTSEPTR